MCEQCCKIILENHALKKAEEAVARVVMESMKSNESLLYPALSKDFDSARRE